MFLNQNKAVLPILVFLVLLGCSKAPTNIDSFDGTEINNTQWKTDGYQDSINRIGRQGEDQFNGGFQFEVGSLKPVAYARLRFPSAGSQVTSSVKILIQGVLKNNPKPFSKNNRPSQQTELTKNKVLWEIKEPWGAGNERMPLYVSSPDISIVINEILAQPDVKNIQLIAMDMSSPIENNYICFSDSSLEKTHVRLETFDTLHQTFLGKECLGRVTDKTATVNVYPLLSMDLYIEYGDKPGAYQKKTHIIRNPGEKGVDILLDGLMPNKRYYYRLAYRRSGQGEFLKAPERNFYTAKPEGAPFTFAIQSDEHLLNWYKIPQNQANKKLYETTLNNIKNSNPDFCISLGDFANTESYEGRHAFNMKEAVERYLLQRKYIDVIAHSIPYYLVIGNHEGENGWYYISTNRTLRNLAVFSTLARKEIMPNPSPNGFYSGDRDRFPEIGLREDYYAWQWGDALFVVLEPFWRTKKNPRAHGENSLDLETLHRYEGWDFTLGKTQYDWLYHTLRGSKAKWKLVFIHHMTTTTVSSNPVDTPFYGRGGIEVVKHKVAGKPTFEWGGEGKDGSSLFESKRPGWKHGPIHDMLVQEKVNIVFHGHDHLFAKQVLDGVVYQCCPQPAHENGYGYMRMARYKNGDLLPNAGHLQVRVGPEALKVEYIQASITDPKKNGQIRFEYVLKTL